MPQLIAMIIIVVGAMIYMFQTFGGTGDKIEGIAQKTSIITEINNIKNGLKLAARAGAIVNGTTTPATDTDIANTLQGLAFSAYFAEQINEQLKAGEEKRTDTRRVYNAISFGGDLATATPTLNAAIDDTNKSTLKLVMVNNIEGAIPGIFVDLSQGGLKSNAGFLESQIATDLAAVATIDRKANAPTAGSLKTGATLNDIDKRTPVASSAGTDEDGMFTIYFKDFGSNEVVLKK